jgi:hypothetical protein
MLDVTFCWQLFLTPLPPLKSLLAGSQAMSPAAAMTGSPAALTTCLAAGTAAIQVRVIAAASNIRVALSRTGCFPPLRKTGPLLDRRGGIWEAMISTLIQAGISHPGDTGRGSKGKLRVPGMVVVGWYLRIGRSCLPVDRPATRVPATGTDGTLTRNV